MARDGYRRRTVDPALLAGPAVLFTLGRINCRQLSAHKPEGSCGRGDPSRYRISRSSLCRRALSSRRLCIQLRTHIYASPSAIPRIRSRRAVSLRPEFALKPALRIGASKRIGLTAIHTSQYTLTVFCQYQLPGLVASWTDGRGGLNLRHGTLPVIRRERYRLSVTARGHDGR